MLTIESGRATDLDDVRTLLRRVGLSADDVAGHIADFLIAREDGVLVAIAALEDHGTAGLLRSVAVAPERQGWGLARYLTNALIERARRRDLAAVYLLTTDAQRYFHRHGFRPISRDDVRPAVQQSAQFQEETCASATAMVIDLVDQPGVKED
ncbi:MAG: arsenic resistance N-acetyltransferase ArsN2 [Armatimonadota bacterium]